MKKLWTLLVCCCLIAPVAAATKRSPKKPVSSAKTVKRSASKGSAHKSTSSSKTSARSRRSGPPKQTAPTPERYMEIQRALSEKGHYDGPIDGQWNAECVAALKKFQEEQNLSPDGKLGALSLIALGLGPKREDVPAQLVTKPEPVSEPE